MIKMFEYTSLCLGQMRCGKLFPLCNQLVSVFKAVNVVYECLVINYMSIYIKNRCNIVDMDALSKQMKSEIVSKGIMKYV